ncbi:hypothetical protein MUP01_13115 [Candidatus Bathyarchaeota archaeon]|nr:hypothetical protein [Candidatus Bathyarchaeota archaeon]
MENIERSSKNIGDNMKVDPNSKLWTYPGGAHSEALHEFRLEAFLNAHEEYLVDEYIEAQLQLNRCGPQDCQFPDAKLNWWLGRQEQIEDEVAYFREAYNITLDKVFEVMECIPHYKDMSRKSQENYRRINGIPIRYNDTG